MSTIYPQEIPSPCVENCCLDLHDICLGCHRHVDEITGWRIATRQQKVAILERCKQRKDVNIRS